MEQVNNSWCETHTENVFLFMENMDDSSMSKLFYKINCTDLLHGFVCVTFMTYCVVERANLSGLKLQESRFDSN